MNLYAAAYGVYCVVVAVSVAIVANALGLPAVVGGCAGAMVFVAMVREYWSDR